MRGYNSWVIADYKKDKVDGNLGSLVAFYRPQVELYKGFWGEMSGEKGKKSRIDEKRRVYSLYTINVKRI
jgi:hypothetical protein